MTPLAWLSFGLFAVAFIGWALIHAGFGRGRWWE